MPITAIANVVVSSIFRGGFHQLCLHLRTAALSPPLTSFSSSHMWTGVMSPVDPAVPCASNIPSTVQRARQSVRAKDSSCLCRILTCLSQHWLYRNEQASQRGGRREGEREGEGQTNRTEIKEKVTTADASRREEGRLVSLHVRGKYTGRTQSC